MSSWHHEALYPLVTIQCITYNHGPYIAAAIEGFLIQRTTFPFRIVIHDDASTDFTPSIIREYYNEYPKLIVPILQERNLMTQGIGRGKYVEPHIAGKYIAICEGDDYWTDDKKLSKQISYLENNEQVFICAHPARRIDAQSNADLGKLGIDIRRPILLSASEVVALGVAFVPTCSVVIRRSVYTREYRHHRLWAKQYRGSFFTKTISAVEGGLAYLPETMSAYRVNTPHSDTMRRKTDAKHAYFQFSSVNADLQDLSRYVGLKTKIALSLLRWNRTITYLSSRNNVQFIRKHDPALLRKHRKELLIARKRRLKYAFSKSMYECRRMILLKKRLGF
jgi:glycosyltransferase involved in cell wall biosynthesis